MLISKAVKTVEAVPTFLAEEAEAVQVAWETRKVTNVILNAEKHGHTHYQGRNFNKRREPKEAQEGRVEDAAVAQLSIAMVSKMPPAPFERSRISPTRVEGQE